MGWLGFAFYALALAFGTFAVGKWRHTQTSPWRGMGLHFDHLAWLDLVAGMAIGVVAIAGIFIVEWVVGVIDVRGAQIPDLNWLIWLPVIAFLAFGEEIAYRSLMLNGLLVLLKVRWPAVIVMAFCFGLAHAGNPHA